MAKNLPSLGYQAPNPRLSTLPHCWLDPLLDPNGQPLKMLVDYRPNKKDNANQGWKIWLALRYI